VKRAALALLLALCALVALGVATGEVGYYNGVNKGVYVHRCGLEIVGQPGFFCGMD
jgi:hypothetical protein